MQKDAETIKQELAKPFAPEDLEWRIQQAFESDGNGYAVPYVTNRAIQDRLDDTVGPENWHNDYKPWHGSGKKEAQICGISIYFEGRGFITKWDGAEDSDIEPIKGGLSDSMKRAAVQWGIGRVLYKMDTVKVKIRKRGKSWVICNEERSKLDKAYTDTLMRLGLTPAKAGGLQSQLTPTPGAESPQETPPPAKPQSGTQPKTQPTQPKAPAPAEKPKVDAPQQIEAEFVITDARVQNGMSGGKNTSLILENPEGKRALAYVQGAHPELKRGMGLVNVKKELKQRDSVVFYLLSDYECLEKNAA